MEKYLHDDRVEALVFDYIHFYGNRNTFAWSPMWYRQAPKILSTNIPSLAPKGLFPIVMENHKKGRYPRAALTGVKYSDIDSAILREFKGVHPAIMQEWLPEADGLYEANPAHKLSRKEIKHRAALFIEKILGIELSKKHFSLVR